MTIFLGFLFGVVFCAGYCFGRVHEIRKQIREIKEAEAPSRNGSRTKGLSDEIDLVE